MATKIHPTAIVSTNAELDVDVEIGPHTIIEEKVQIGRATTIGPSCLLQGPTTIGRKNKIYGHASIGSAPQDLKFGGEDTRLIIGDNNQIREFTTLNRGTVTGIGKSEIGNNNLLMAYVHVAHDCIVGNRVILANAATLAGHVEIQDYSTVGAFTGVHQFCRVGKYAFVGGYSVLTRDVLPFMKTVGIRNTCKSYGPNTIGLERQGFSKKRLTLLIQANRTLFRQGIKLKEAIEQIKSWDDSTEDIEFLLQFIETSERGFVR